MQQRSIFRIGVPIAVAALALSACGSREPVTTGTAGTATKTVKIGVIAPLSGGLSALGLGIKNSVDLAIKQANESNAVPGWKFELSAQDDEAKPEVGKNAATKLASDDAVIGVVGTLNSSVAQSTQPVLAAANIAQVSPANTNPSLTKGADAAAPKRSYANYFRTCTTDAVQGPFAAQYLLGQGIKKVATIHDKKTYGQGLVDAFTAEFKKGGGEVSAAETIGENDKDFSSVISKIKPSAPGAVYYGGEYPQAGPMSQQMKSQGLTVPLMGGDGIFDPKYLELAGATANGDLATSVGAPTESTEAGKKFLDQYKAAGYAEPAAAYGGYSYDAAKAIIEAAKTALKDAMDVKSARAGELTALGKVAFDGVTGKVAFDEFGDTTSKVLTVYKIDGAKWMASKTDTFK
ncbi:MAG: branched-chain amino acid ABC transporter substrate-binding protein [Candidatus Phosphoribacter sp.]